MANYFIRQSGSDSNAGTSAGAAWATLGKALNAGGVAAGDIVYVGAGVYREQITIGITPASEVQVIADVDGAQTGDPGQVRWSGETTDDRTSTFGNPINLNGKSNLTFKKFVFDHQVVVTTVGSTNIKFTDCTFWSAGNTCLSIRQDATAGTSVIDGCTFVCQGICVQFQVDLTAAAGYASGWTMKNCLCLAFGAANAAVRVPSGGAGANKGGAPDIYNCTIMAALNCYEVVSTNVDATTNVGHIYNCLLYANGTALKAATAGQIVEDYNYGFGTAAARSNVTAGTHSQIGNTAPQMSTILEIGQSERYGGNPRHWFMPADLMPALSFGAQAGGPSVDMLGGTRPSGGSRLLDSGTATAGANGTITDTNKSWRTNVYAGKNVHITGGTGSGQIKQIVSNTATALTVSGNWITNPDNTSTYHIEDGCHTTSGKATAGAATSLTDGNASWGTARWVGATVEITAGTGSGQTKQITSHTATVLTVSTWTTNPDNTSQYKIYRTSQTAPQYAAGALERPNTARKETTTVDAGSSAWSGHGCWQQDIQIPVDAISTTIGIKSQFDSNYGGGTKPTMQVLNGGGCGVSDATSTSTQTAGNWYSHSLNFTPTSKGIVTIRLRAAGAVDSKTVFDTITYS